MSEMKNDWYIDRAININHKNFNNNVQFFYEKCKEKIESKELIKLMEKDFDGATGNLNATLTHYRDIGILNKENKIGNSAKEYIEKKLDLSSFILDLLIKRPAKKIPTKVRPFVIICKFFDILIQMEVDKDNIYVTNKECIQYLYNINDYEELDYEFVEQVIYNRNIDKFGNKIDNDKIESNEITNINIWFNALREIPIFRPTDKNKDCLIPNVEQKEFFSFISSYGGDLLDIDFQNNDELYNYYILKERGISEIIPRVILKETIIEEKDSEKIFDYLFGYKEHENFKYTQYFKFPCFGIYFPFISIPLIAVRQIYYDNEQVGGLIYGYISNNNNIIKDKQLYILNMNKYSKKKEIKGNKLNKVIQDIYFGAPGTGKSYIVEKIIKECYPDVSDEHNPFVFKTTIYPDYSYFDFIGNIMPVSNNGKISYDFNPGIFSNALLKALLNENNDIFLIVEEMSRGNIASIFGDIFQLLDRDIDGNSIYSITNEFIRKYLSQNGIHVSKIKIPGNLHIIGTINTSDQNVNVIDTAFKRRFNFVYSEVEPLRDIAKNNYMNSYEFELQDGTKFEWNKLYMALNTFIVEKLLLNEDKQIGQFFIKFDHFKGLDIEMEKYNSIRNKLLHYLWDDVQQASIVDNVTIFDIKYKSFSKLYKDFGKYINVFSEEFLETYNEQII